MRFLHDIRAGARALRRTPGFALTAVAILALGIGLSTAVFTVADALVLRPLPVRDQARVLMLTGATADGRTSHYPLGLQAARDFAVTSRTLGRVALVAYEGATPETVREGGRISRLRRALVSGDFFAVLDARPVLGRTLRAEDDLWGTAPSLVLSHRAWQERFGGAPDVVGRRIVMHEDGATYTVVGVMPPGLDYPRGVDAWAPLLAVIPPRSHPYVAVDLLGRLAPGATAGGAVAELTRFFGRDDASAAERTLRGAATPLTDVVVGDTRPAVIAFSAASVLLLLITCVNVATLLLVRGLARSREVAIRTALGAARSKIVGQLLVEHALLAAAGGVLGVALAWAAVRGFVAYAPAGIPRLDQVRLNGIAVAAATGITAVAMLLFGLAPALLTSKVDAQQVLRTGTRQGGGRGARRATEALVAGQIALALVVLAAAGLVGRSLRNLERADLAFDAAPLLLAELALPANVYDTPAKQLALLDRLLPAVAAIPGVRAVSPVVAAPFSGASGWDGRLASEGQSDEEQAGNPMLNMELVTPSYFAALGVPILRGRRFSESDRDGAPPVVMLSESASRRYWPGADPLGRRLTMGRGSTARAFTVVGIVPDTRYRDLREARPSIYFPLGQSFFPFAPTTLAVRASGPPAQLTPALRRVLAEVAPDVALASAAPFDALMAEPLAQPRLDALLLAVFAAAAVTLAAVGLFGVMATMVRQRSRELGIRMALGATSSSVGRLVIRRAMLLAAIGAALGLAGASATNYLVAALLYEVTPTDLPTLAAVTGLLLVVAALASLIPARAGTRIDPGVALRSE
jgi:predicted permease